MKRGYILLFFLFCITNFGVFGSDARESILQAATKVNKKINKKIKLKISCRVCAVGEPIRVELRIAVDHKKIKSLDVPQQGKLQYLGQSSSIQLHNFNLNKSKVYRYRVIFHRKGRYQIGPANILLDNGETISTNQVGIEIIEVDKPQKKQKTATPKLVARLERKKSIATQPLLLRYYLKLEPGMSLLYQVQLRHLPRMPGSVIEPVPGWEKELAADTKWGMPLKAFVIYPIQAGLHELKHATFLAQVRHDRQVFGFFKVPSKKNFSLKASNDVLKVRSLDVLYPQTDVATAVKGAVESKLFWLKQKEKKPLGPSAQLKLDKSLVRLRFVLSGRTYWQGIELNNLQFIPEASGEVLSVERKKEIISLEDPLRQRISFDIALNIKNNCQLKIAHLNFLNIQSMKMEKVGPFRLSFQPSFGDTAKEDKASVVVDNKGKSEIWLTDIILIVLLFVLVVLVFWFIVRLSLRRKIFIGNERERNHGYHNANDNKDNKIEEKKEHTQPSEDQTRVLPQKEQKSDNRPEIKNSVRKQGTLVYELERIYRDFITRSENEKGDYKATVRKLKQILTELEQSLPFGEPRARLQHTVAEIDFVLYGPPMESQKIEERIKLWTESVLDALQNEVK